MSILALKVLSANPTKWSNILKQFVGDSCLSVFDHFVGLAPKGLKLLYLLCHIHDKNIFGSVVFSTFIPVLYLKGSSTCKCFFY